MNGETGSGKRTRNPDSAIVADNLWNVYCELAVVTSNPEERRCEGRDGNTLVDP